MVAWGFLHFFWTSLVGVPHIQEGLFRKRCLLHQNLQTHCACTTALRFLTALDLNYPGFPSGSRYAKRSILGKETLFSVLRIQSLWLMGFVHTSFCVQWHRGKWNNPVFMLTCLFYAQQHITQVRVTAHLSDTLLQCSCFCSCLTTAHVNTNAFIPVLVQP